MLVGFRDSLSFTSSSFPLDFLGLGGEGRRQEEKKTKALLEFYFFTEEQQETEMLFQQKSLLCGE